MRTSSHPPRADQSAMGPIDDSVGKCKNGGIFPSRCGISTTFRAKKSENIPPKVAFPNRVIYRAHRRFIGLGRVSTVHWPINQRCANKLCAYGILPMLLVKIHYRPQ